MTLRRVVPVEGGALETEHPDARSTLLAWYAPHGRERVRLTLVATLDGRAAGPDGTSESLTSRTDRMILGVIREHADVVLVGAETVRREGLRRPRRAAIAVVSATGDLSGHRFDEPPRHGGAHPAVIMLTTRAGALLAAQTAPMAEVIELPGDDRGRLRAADLIGALGERGLHAIAVEGGPALATQLLEAGLVDELCLTVMPRLGGAALPLLGAAMPPLNPMGLRQLLVDDAGAQFGRWSLRP
ncbi:dihydrofolate reductase family protein [Microcella sp.]|uniref:dihydrofolate reductase family protein n=1 Tax=Microcella sp. TaxID=1913979 RepID=UPI00391D37C8